MLLKTQTTILFFITLTISAFSQTWKIHDKVQVKYGNTQYYNAEIIDVKDSQYKIHYDGYGSNWDEWVTPDRIIPTTTNSIANTNETRNTQQHTQPGNGKYQVGQKVEAYNVTWYKATVTGFGSGDLAGYIKVHYDDYSSASDQYLKASSIRIPKNTPADNYTAGPRNGRYTILSYGNIYNPITLGYFDLNNGSYTYYDAAKKPIGKGIYQYDGNSKEVKWQSGPLKDYGANAGFEIDREGKTHKIRLKYSTIGTNSTDR